MQFDLPKEQSSIIKVLGVGGGGGHAVTHMFNQGIRNVNFVICNTDAQDLDSSPVPNKIQLGPELTEGRGAGAKPEIGKQATEESINDIKQILSSNTKMVFITVGMGGGTGTGGAPVIAELTKEMGILTVGIATTPFSFEGPLKMQKAMKGIEEMRKHVDTFLVISNDKLREIYGNIDYSVAFAHADNILTTAAKSIAEIITIPGYVNVDFEDVNTVMRNSGAAIMGSGSAEGEERALRAVESALNSPLLNDSDIKGAQDILLNMSSGSAEVTLDEVTEITDYIRTSAGQNTNLIFGTVNDESLNDKINVTVIATGFESNQQERSKETEKIIVTLDDKTDVNSTGSNSGDDSLTKKDREKVGEESRGQVTIEFDVDNDIPQTLKKNNKLIVESDNSLQEQQEKNNENDEQRKERLKDLSMNVGKKLDNPEKVNQLEKQPAYLRKNIKLDEPPHSSETNLSKFTLETEEDNEEDKPKIKENNSFLHDNVD